MNLFRNKFFPLFPLLFAGLCAAGGEDAWTRENAVCRLKLLWPKSGEESCLAFDRYCFPGDPAGDAAAFSPSGRRIPLARGAVNDVLIFPARDAAQYPEEYFYLYLGEGVESPRPGEQGESAYAPSGERTALKLEGVFSRQGGNFREYLQQRHQALERNLVRNHEDFQRNLRTFFMEGMMSPDFLCKPFFYGWWDVNRYATEQSQRPVTRMLYRSRALQRPARWRIFHNVYPMRVFFYRPLHTTSRFRATVQRYIGGRERVFRLWKEAKEADPDEVLFPVLVKSFEEEKNGGRPRRRHLSESIPKVSLAPRELDLWGNLAIRFSGKLLIDESGLYEFEVMGNTLWQFDVGGETLARGVYEPEMPPGMVTRFSRNLSRGTYPFSFYCSRNNDTEDVHVRIRTGSGDWENLDMRYFTLAVPLEVEAVEMRSGGEFPVVTRKELGTVFTGKTSAFRLTEFSADGELYWEESVPGGEEKIPLSEQGSAAVAVRREQSWHLTDGRGNRVVPSSPRTELFMTVERPGAKPESTFPATLYDDEGFTLSAALYSQLPFDLDIRAEGKFTPLNGGPENFNRAMLLPGRRRSEGGIRFSESGELKMDFPMHAGMIGDGFDFAFRFYLPGMELGRLSGRILPASQLPEKLGYRGSHLTDGEGTCLALIMHRPRLAEKREWELLRLVKERDPAPRELLIVGGEKQLTDGQLEEFSRKYGVGVRRRNWPARDPAGRSRLLRGLAELLPEFKKTVADTVILVPPEGDMCNLPAELNARYLALALEIMESNPAVRRILLAPPAPGEDPRARLWEEEWELRIRRLAREYGVELLELNAASDPAELLTRKLNLGN